MLIDSVSVQQTLEKEIEESQRWLKVEKETPSTDVILEKELN